MLKRWFAIVCKVAHPDGIAVGEVYSYTTSAPTAVDAARFELVDLGEHEEHIDFGARRWNSVTKTLESFTPAPDEIDTLLAAPVWTPQDRDATLRAILRRIKGR